MNVIVGRHPNDQGGFVLDKFSLYYPDNSAILGDTWDLLQGYSFRTAALSGSLNRAGLHGLRAGSIPVAEGAEFDSTKHGLVIDGASAYEDCAYVEFREGETNEQREQRIDAMVHGMVAAYGSQGILSLSYDPVERQQGMTTLESEWRLLKRVAGAMAAPTEPESGPVDRQQGTQAAKEMACPVLVHSRAECHMPSPVSASQVGEPAWAATAEAAAACLRQVRDSGGRLLVLTGAGMSVSSGVPVFRGADGSMSADFLRFLGDFNSARTRHGLDPVDDWFDFSVPEMFREETEKEAWAYWRWRTLRTLVTPAEDYGQLMRIVEFFGPGRCFIECVQIAFVGFAPKYWQPLCV